MMLLVTKREGKSWGRLGIHFQGGISSSLSFWERKDVALWVFFLTCRGHLLLDLLLRWGLGCACLSLAKLRGDLGPGM